MVMISPVNPTPPLSARDVFQNLRVDLKPLTVPDPIYSNNVCKLVLTIIMKGNKENPETVIKMM